MEKFSPELRADLQEVYGVDLAALFNGKRWVHLLALIDGLQQGSRYLAAFLSDPETAEQILDVQQADDEGKEPSGPSLVNYQQEHYQLAEVIDQLKVLTATISAVNGGKPKKPEPTPRPKTMVEEIKKKREEESAQRVADVFSPQSE